MVVSQLHVSTTKTDIVTKWFSRIYYNRVRQNQHIFTKEDLQTKFLWYCSPAFQRICQREKTVVFNGDELIDLPLPNPPQVAAQDDNQENQPFNV